MKNKYLNIIFNIIVLTMLPIVVYGIVYEFFISNKDIVPKNVNTIITIVGFVCLISMGIIYLLDKFVFKDEK